MITEGNIKSYETSDLKYMLYKIYSQIKRSSSYSKEKLKLFYSRSIEILQNELERRNEYYESCDIGG